MGYFDDFQLLNVTDVRMYGSSDVRMIHTSCHYIGIIRGSYIIEGNTENRPMVYLTPANIDTLGGWFSPAGSYRDNLYIECTGARADRFMSAFSAETATSFIPVADPEPFICKLLELKHLFADGSLLHRHRIILCFEEFAVLLESERQAVNYAGISRCNLENVLRQISREPGKKWDFSALASAAGITLRHWNRIFSRVTGMPPGSFVHACRIKLARELLTSTDIQIKEIAGKCGFENVSDFSRFFRKKCGISPGRYRRNRVL
ncbi:MAG: AraC family transcriptional regulator [Lentisphaeria bacterium]|nr:AraC family transcriptional regulator [Lentisphaeria bacterium]